MILKSSIIISAITLISRVFGYAREIMMAMVLGTGPVANAFHIAFRFSNVFRSFFAEGAFTASFVPIFTAKNTKDTELARTYASQILSMLLITLSLFTIIIEIFMPQIMYFLAPGFVKNPELLELSIVMARITFPYLVFMSLSALYGGMLGVFGRFSAVAAAPILLNISMIVALAIGHAETAMVGKMLCLSIVVSGILQLGLVYYNAKRKGLTLKWERPKINDDTRKFLRALFPGMMSASIVQINLWLSTIIATFYESAVSLLYYADRVVQLPLSLIGTSVGMVLLPAFSKYHHEQDHDASNNIKNRSIELTMFLCLPTSLIMLLLSKPIIVATFQYGVFSESDSEKTAMLLAIFAVALPAFILNKVFTPCFHAVSDTKTPFQVASMSLMVNAVSNFIFLIYFPVYYGIAISTVISSCSNTYVLAMLAKKRDLYKSDKLLFIRLRKIIFALIMMTVYHFVMPYANVFNHIVLDALINVGLYYLIFLVFSFILGTYKISELKQLIKGK